MLEACAPRLQNLVAWLEAADKQDILAYAIAYRNAAEALTEAVDKLTHAGQPISEDFRNWAVAQGKATWQSAPSNASAAYARYIARESRWDNELRNPAYAGYRSPHYIAIPIFEDRFGEDLLDHLDAIP